jgi:hypothetical protein
MRHQPNPLDILPIASGSMHTQAYKRSLHPPPTLLRLDIAHAEKNRICDLLV